MANSFNPVPKVGRPKAPQGRLKGTGDKYGTKAMCARCQITYEVPAGYQAKCPLCDVREQLEQTRAALVEANNHREQLTGEVTRLRSHVDLVMAIRDSLELIDTDDITFLKSVLYRYRDDKSVTLKVTHQTRKGTRKPVANGFLAVVKGGPPEAHACTSVGGAAVAAYFDEGLRTQGPIATMQNLMRAMNQHLAGAT